MKIIKSTLPENPTVGDMCIGDVFSTSEGQVYMRTDEVVRGPAPIVKCVRLVGTYQTALVLDPEPSAG